MTAGQLVPWLFVVALAVTGSGAVVSSSRRGIPSRPVTVWVFLNLAVFVSAFLVYRGAQIAQETTHGVYAPLAPAATAIFLGLELTLLLTTAFVDRNRRRRSTGASQDR